MAGPEMVHRGFEDSGEEAGMAMLTWQARPGQGAGQGHADLGHAIALQQRVASGSLPPLQQGHRQGG